MFGGGIYAQSTGPAITIEPGNLTRVCSFREISLPARLTGTFNASNQFFIEFTDGWSDKVIARFPAVMRSGNIVASVNSDTLRSESYLIGRVVSTNPAVKSNQAQLGAFTSRGAVTLAGPTTLTDTVNAGASVQAIFSNSANNAVTITLNDSTRLSLAPGNTPVNIPVNASGEIFITKAVNSCGVAVPFSGSRRHQVNSLTIVPFKFLDAGMCKGSRVHLTYAITGGTLPPSARFRLRFEERYYDDAPGRKVFEVPATVESPGVLAATIPEQADLKYGQGLKVYIIVDSPALVSPALADYVSIAAKPDARITSESSTIVPGDYFGVSVQLYGAGPFTVEMTNGQVFHTNDTYLSATYYPVKTETFAVKSLKSRCGATTDVSKRNVVVTLAPGIFVPFTGGKQVDICENQKVRLPFVSTAALTANTRYTVVGTAGTTTFEFEGKVVNDSIEFTIPFSTAAMGRDGYFSIRSLRVKTTNPAYTAPEVFGYRINGIPKITYRLTKPAVLPYPKFYDYITVIDGGAPFTVTYPNGEMDRWEFTEKLERTFFEKSGSYQLKRVQNVCYSNEQIEPLNVTVQSYTAKTPAISVRPASAQSVTCTNDSIEVYFDAYGEFAADNEFRIFSVYNTSKALLTVKKPGRYKLPLTDEEAKAMDYINVASTNPVVTGEAVSRVYREIKPFLYAAGTEQTSADNPLVVNMDEQVWTNGLWDIRSNRQDSYNPYAFEVSGGGRDYRFEKFSNEYNFAVAPPRSVVTPFVLKTVSNACGTTDVNATSYVLWKGYNLLMKNFEYERAYCPGEEIWVPFGIQGTAPGTTPVHLQIATLGGTFTTLGTVPISAGEFRVKVPELEEGQYSIRIISEDKTEASNATIRINTKPTATVAYDQFGQPPANGQINAGQKVAVNYILTGGGPYRLTATGLGDETSDGGLYREFQPEQDMVFEVKSVSNRCGYGTAAGNLSVKVTPVIRTLTFANTAVCTGGTVDVTYEVLGKIPDGQNIVFQLVNANGARREIGATRVNAGTIALSIPAEWPLSGNMLVCSIGGTAVSASQPMVVGKPAELELTGNVNVNAGDQTAIELRAKTAGNLPVKIRLSDGVEREIQFFYMGAAAVLVKPVATTTYRILEASSTCGTVPFSGTATVTVIPAGARNVKTTYVTGPNPASLCEEDSVIVHFVATGSFSAGNRFGIQLLDDQGKMLKEWVPGGQVSPLKTLFPAGIDPKVSFRVRVVASDAGTSSADYMYPVTLKSKATAAFESAQVVPDPAGNAKVVVKFTGTGSWTYSYANDLETFRRTSFYETDTIALTNVRQATYQLVSVRNDCGTGKIIEPSKVAVAVVLGVENPVYEEVTLAPNPVRDRLRLIFKQAESRTIVVSDAAGRRLFGQKAHQQEEVIDMSHLPAGIYILQIESRRGVHAVKVLRE
ncbi:hypothetical protein GCM10010967_30660 [Dyadobacter beijingensis]|uniref:Secretion system C-terminal sorting domain-containing protein n=1 Tax=Dyadobacter beijingensis TaxID=365489 RepID=A0ABQ2I0B9_9BACT|nr:hypothetical protein GCM10010967_30660 [Dyadobacter beijingensis]